MVLQPITLNKFVITLDGKYFLIDRSIQKWTHTYLSGFRAISGIFIQGFNWLGSGLLCKEIGFQPIVHLVVNLQFAEPYQVTSR